MNYFEQRIRRIFLILAFIADALTLIVTGTEIAFPVGRTFPPSPIKSALVFCILIFTLLNIFIRILRYKKEQKPLPIFRFILEILIIIFIYQVFMYEDRMIDDNGARSLVGPALSALIYLIEIAIFSIPAVTRNLISNMERNEKHKLTTLQINEVNPEKNKNQLYGMIKLDKKIDLQVASKLLNSPIQNVKGLIYELVGEGKLEGSFDGNMFMIESDVNDFLLELDSQFKNWNENEEKKIGKK
jgi:hypothetical protein